MHNKDRRIKNDVDILEVEKFLEKFETQINKKEKSKKKGKSKSICIINQILINTNDINNKRYLSNNNLSKNLITNEFIKKSNTANTKMNEEKYNNLINAIILEKEKEKERKKLPTLIIPLSNKEIIESYSKKSNNILNGEINQKNIINDSKNNTKAFSLTFKRAKKNNINNNENNLLDYNNLIYNLITNRNYCSYNKKYHYKLGIKTENNSKEKDSKSNVKKTDVSSERESKFKNILDFVNDLKMNKVEFSNNNKTLCNIIIENEYNRECFFRKKNNIKPIRCFMDEGNKKVFINDNIEHNLSKINYMTKRIKKKRGIQTYKRNFFFQNAITSKEMVKYGDIYF